MATTIRDIAQRAGVCRATVSRVINNSGYVREETRQRVLRYIRELDYTPSSNARSLSNSRSDTIAVIIPDITNPFFCDIISGISQVLNQERYDLIFFNTDESPAREQSALTIAAGYMVSGIIFCPCSDSPKMLQYIQPFTHEHIPLILVDREITGLECSGVFTDNFRGSYDAVRALIDEGRQRIAIIHGPLDTLPGRDRLRGYCQALKDAGFQPIPQYICRGDFKRDSAAYHTQALLSLPEPPDAIFSCNNLMSIGCTQMLAALGVHIPNDIGFAGFDELDRYGILGSRLTVVVRDNAEMGRAAAQLLLKHIEDFNTPIRKIVLRPHLRRADAESDLPSVNQTIEV